MPNQEYKNLHDCDERLNFQENDNDSSLRSLDSMSQESQENQLVDDDAQLEERQA